MILPRFGLYILVIAVVLAGVRDLPLAADRAADHSTETSDSQAFLQSHMTPAGAAASTFAPAVGKLLAQMTLKEKVGQMNQYNGDWEATGPITKDGDKQNQIRKGG